MRSGVAMAWWVAFSPNITRGTPLENTICAACGSHSALNSAAGVQLPTSRLPPIQTICRMRGAMSGASRSASATLVSGPVGSSVTSPGRERTASMMNRAACSASACRVGAGSRGPSRPVWPCTLSAERRGTSSGRSAPAYTGVSLPISASVTRAFRVVRSRPTLPKVVLTPSTSSSGEACASRMFTASSWPGSPSRMTGRGAE